MNNKITLLTCMILLIAGFMQFASAAAEIQGISGNKVSVNHGESFEVSFSIKNNNAEGDFKNITNIEVNLPQLISGNINLPGNWSSAKVGTQQTYTIDNNKIVFTELKILNKTSSEPIKLTFTTQKGAIPGLYKGDATFSAKFQDGVTLTNAAISAVNLEITIPSAAALAISASNQISLTQNTSIITLSNNGNTVLNNIQLNVTGNLNLTLSQTSIPTLDIGKGISTIKATADLSLLKFGTNSGTITATAQDGTTASTSFSTTKSFCVAGQKTSNITITSAEVTDFGDDEKEWKLLDEITFEVEVKNIGNQNVDNIMAELGLFNSNGDNVVRDLIFIDKDDETIDIGDISDGNTETATFTFKVPADINLGDYKLAIKAYGKDEGEANLCADTSTDFDASFYLPIKISGESDDGKLIGFDNIKLTPTSDAECGDTMTLIFDVINVGDKDQDQVKISLANAELNIDQFIEIKKNLNRGDKEKSLKFTFNVPQGLANKVYNLELDAEYGYSKNRGEYSDSLDDEVVVPLKVIGCNVQPSTAPLAEISVLPLDKEAKAGEDLIVTTTIKNIGTKNNTYVIGARGFESWAKLKAATERIITLKPGEPKEVVMTFTINSDAAGEKTFTIESLADGKTDSRVVKVVLPENGAAKSPFSGFNFGGSTLLWVVGIMNVILLILIVIIAIRLSRR